MELRLCTWLVLCVALLFPGGAIAQSMNWKLGPLHRAAYTNDTIALQKWLEKGEDVNKGTVNGVTPLHIAAFEGKKESVRMLLDHGANPNLKDNKGRTPLDLAFIRKHLEVQGMLIPVTDAEAQSPAKPSLAKKEQGHGQ